MSSSQKVLTVYSQAADGGVQCYNATYSTARSGGGTMALDLVQAGPLVGQYYSGSLYYFREGFFYFDTSEIPIAATIDSVTASICVAPVFTQTATLELRHYDWEPTLETTAFVAGASLSSSTLCASIASASITGVGTYDAMTVESALATNIVKGGATTFLMCTDRMTAGTTPDADPEYGQVYGGDSGWPLKLVITYTSEDIPAGRSLVARPFTTRAAAAESIARQHDTLLDWWIADGVARAEERPTALADLPRDRWYVVARDTPGVSVSLSMDSEETPDIICVVYRAYGVSGVNDGALQRVYYPQSPVSSTERVEMVDLSGNYMNTTDATTYATNVYTRASANAMQATITVRGGLRTVEGTFRPAPLIDAGDWIDVVDLPGHVPAYITGVTYERDSGVCTITTGQQEQRELVIPGLSALEALQRYGGDAAYETYDDSSYGGEDGTGETPVKPGSEDEGIVTGTGTGTPTGDSSTFGRNVPYPTPPGYVPDPTPGIHPNFPAEMP